MISQDKTSGIQLPWIKELGFDIRTQFVQNSFLIGVSLTAYILCFGLGVILEKSFSESTFFYLRILLSHSLILFSAYLIFQTFRIVVIKKSPRPSADILLRLRERLTDTSLYARILTMLVIPAFGFHAFNEAKYWIPSLVPFYLDDPLIEIERFLHFGKLPWDWVSGMFSNPNFLSFLDYVYSVCWFLLVIGLWCYAALKKPTQGWERQYVLSFILSWIILGVILATLMSSVGPCFYGYFYDGVNPYEEQMTYLRGEFNSNLYAVYFQDLLWQAYDNPTGDFTSGISAMPSMHNSMALLFVYAGYNIRRWFGHLMLLNLVIIFLGSVALGWHYAIDAYVGWGVVALIWVASGKMVRRHESADSKPNTHITALEART